MPFDWEEYLHLAKFLKDYNDVGGSFSQQATRRSAASRAYYASYCYVCDYTKFTRDKKGEDHGKLREHLKAKNLIVIASYLKDLRMWRNACDYDTDLEFDLYAVANTSIARAKEVFRRLKRK